MPICHYCGDEIEFRHLDGAPTPVHINGGWCPGFRDRVAATGPFQTVQSYLNPNAYCPVCGEQVYFYQSPFGGRVFFDNVDWPWPKHGCTDTSKSQTTTITQIAEGFRSTFRNDQGELLHLYKLSVEEEADEFHFKFKRMNSQEVFYGTISKREMNDLGIDLQDLKAAPSFVVRTYESYREVEFIAGRLGKIARIRIARIRR